MRRRRRSRRRRRTRKRRTRSRRRKRNRRRLSLAQQNCSPEATGASEGPSDSLRIRTPRCLW